jgi:hypothetical protein
MQPAKKNAKDQELRPFVEALQVGVSVGHANLTLVPLRGERRERIAYLLAVEAIEAGTLEITEVSEGGSVPELLATNEAQSMVLLMDGEELVGAKQNRILNTSVLLPARSETKIPVSCVEQGRWRHVSMQFRSGSYSPAGLRARKSRDVSYSLRTVGQAMSDQGAVWDDVAERSARLQSPSPTMAMHDVVDQNQDSLNAYVEALTYPADACGVVAAIDGRFVALDLFDKAQTMEQVWPRLVTGYAMDAISRRADAKPVGKPKTFTAKGAGALLEHLGQVPCVACPSVGVGEDWRFEAEDILGQALIVPVQEESQTGEPTPQVCVHISAFPNDPHERDAGPGPSILPPSRRRPGRGGNPPDDEVVY